MALSRRKFMKAGALAAAFASLPLKSAMGRNVLEGREASLFSKPPLSPKVNPEQLSYYTESSFTSYLNTQFNVYLTPSSTRALKLIQVNDYLSTLSRSALRKENSPNTECFSLLMTTPPSSPFEQDTYLIEHNALGTFYLFVVPVNEQKRGRSLDYYEAVVFRRPDSTNNSALANNGNQPGRQAGVTGTSSGDRLSEEEIFYFRPQELKSNAAPATVIDPGAPGRLAASKIGLAQAPDIGGLRLGMTIEQVLALFPGSKNDPDVRASLAQPPSPFGTQTLLIKPGKYSSNKKFDGVNQITFMFLDGRVSALYVGYTSPLWLHVDEFIAKFSAETKLPGADSWDAYAGMDTQLKTLRCNGFEISLFAGGNNVQFNYVQMLDLTAQQRLRERRAKARVQQGAKS